MRKLSLEMEHESSPDWRSSKLPTVLFVLFLVLGLTPLALEGASLCLVNWKEYMGVSASAETPTIDAIHETIESTKYELWAWITPCFHRLPWDTKVILPCGAIVMALSMLMLKR